MSIWLHLGLDCKRAHCQAHYLNNIFTDVQLDGRQQNWSPHLKIFVAALTAVKNVIIHHAYGRTLGLTPVPAITLHTLWKSCQVHPTLLLLTYSFPRVPEQQWQGRLLKSENKSPPKNYALPVQLQVNGSNALSCLSMIFSMTLNNCFTIISRFDLWG